MPGNLQHALTLRNCGLDVYALDLCSPTLWYNPSETSSALLVLLPSRLKTHLRGSRPDALGYPVHLKNTVATFAQLLEHAHRYFTPFVNVAATLPEADEFPTLYVREHGP